MNNNKQQSHMDQVWKYTRILAVITGISLSAFSLTGYLIVTAPEPAAEVIEIENSFLSLTGSEVSENSLVDRETKPLEITSDESKYNKTKKAVDVIPFSDPDENKTHHINKSGESSEKALAVTEQDMFENFKTECQNGIVNISWTTDGTDDESFKLEFSSDSINFNLINEVPVHIEVNKNTNLFKLTLPATKAETKYFRLRRDFPGNAFMYSQAVKVACVQNMEQQASIDVFPSGNGSYRVIIDSKINDYYNIVLSDMNEIELVKDEFEIVKGVNQFTFKSGIQPRGNYNLKVTNGQTVVQKKVAIK